MKPLVAAPASAALMDSEWSLRELDRLVAQALPTLPATDEPIEVHSEREDQASRLRSMLVEPAQSAVQSSAVSALNRSAVPAAPHAARSTRIVVIASGKGGVGKTTLSVNLAIALAERGLRVTLLDADFGTANADVICGLAPHARLDHVFMPGSGGVKWNDAAPRSLRDIAITAPGGFRLIPGTTGVARMADLSATDRAAIVAALHEIERDTDILLIDAGAGVGRSVTEFMAAADLNVVVATPEPTAIADAYALIKCNLAVKSTDDPASPDARVALVMNQVFDHTEGVRVHARIRAVCDRFLGVDCPLLGCVAQDVRVPEAVRARQPLLIRTSSAAAATHIRVVAGEITRRLGVGASVSTGAIPATGVRALVRRLLGKPLGGASHGPS